MVRMRQIIKYKHFITGFQLNKIIKLIQLLYIMKQAIIKLIFFSFLIFFSCSQNCVGSSSDDLIQTGVVDVINPISNARQTLAQIQVTYKIPSTGFQSALSFIDFQYNAVNGFDFNLRSGRIGTSNFLGISIILLQDKRWQRIKVSYLVHSRKDMWIGSYTNNLWSLSNVQNSSGLLNAQTQGVVDNWSPDNSSLVFLKAVFLSGVQTGLGNFSFSLTNVTFDKVRGIVGVTLANASRSIQQVTITYIIFVSPHPRFAFDSFTYPGSVPSSDYGIIGNSGFNSGVTNGRYYGINIESLFLNCYGNCPSSCILKTNCSQLNGTAIDNDCTICPSNSRYNSTRKACVTLCGVNQQFINGTCQCTFGFIKLGDTCVNRCGINQEWNGNSCQCITGHARVNGVCRPCPANSVVNSNRDSCVCSNGTIFDSNTTRCVPAIQCPQNSSLVIQGGVSRCKCDTDFYANGPLCTFCPSPALWNTANLLCYCPGTNQNFNGQTCITCRQGQFFNASTRSCECYSPRVISNNGECRCPNNLSYNSTSNRCFCSGNFQILGTNNQCVCTSPYIRLQNNQCGLVCPQNQWWVGGQCVCRPPYVRINTKCTINCTVNQKWNGLECACIDNFFRINGTCQTCQIGQIFNSTTKSCQNICGLNQVFNGTNCVCRQNYFRINSICSQCPTGTGFRPSAGICVACLQNEVSSNSLCVCKTNFYIVNGVCDQCPLGTNYNKDKQVCQSLCGTNQIFDGKGCVCATGFVIIKNACDVCPLGTVYNSTKRDCDTACKANQVWNGQACVCAPNFFLINKVCDKCPTGTTYNSGKQSCDSICGSNQVFNGTQCICAPGYVIINRACDVCPVGTIYNSSKQSCDNLCKNNEVYNGTQCICASGFVIINGACDKCPNGSYFDDSLQKCAVQPVCPARSEWNPTKLQCVCLIADQYLINGSCQKCGNNAGWNGTRCVCRIGFFLIGTECLTCDINTSYNATLKDCVCNRGFFGNRTLCNKCDATCGRCTGPRSNQCLECTDLSFQLNNGSCTRPTCIAGKYFDGKTCQQCTSYCISCRNNQTCNQCSSGFSLSTIDLGSTMKLQYCEQICGDGKRYEYQCDDGNTVNGDGCSDQCEVESGYTCSGGTTTTKSTCLKNNPTRTIITPKGAVQLTGKVLQGVTLSNLPEQLVEKGACTKCSQVLLVSIIQAQAIPSFRVNFLPTTQYKYLIEFDFQGIFAIPPFTFTLRINPDYSKLFSQADMAQLITLTVDTALLARGQAVEDLTIEQILGQKIPVADSDLKKIYG